MCVVLDLVSCTWLWLIGIRLILLRMLLRGHEAAAMLAKLGIRPSLEVLVVIQVLEHQLILACLIHTIGGRTLQQRILSVLALKILVWLSPTSSRVVQSSRRHLSHRVVAKSTWAAQLTRRNQTGFRRQKVIVEVAPEMSDSIINRVHVIGIRTWQQILWQLGLISVLLEHIHFILIWELHARRLMELLLLIYRHLLMVLTQWPRILLSVNVARRRTFERLCGICIYLWLWLHVMSFGTLSALFEGLQVCLADWLALRWCCLLGLHSERRLWLLKLMCPLLFLSLL